MDDTARSHVDTTSQWREHAVDEFVHGTKFDNLKSILEDGLLAKTHDISLCDAVPEDGCIPGLRERPEILIILDKTKMLSEGLVLQSKVCLVQLRISADLWALPSNVHEF